MPARMDQLAAQRVWGRAKAKSAATVHQPTQRPSGTGLCGIRRRPPASCIDRCIAGVGRGVGAHLLGSAEVGGLCARGRGNPPCGLVRGSRGQRISIAVIVARPMYSSPQISTPLFLQKSSPMSWRMTEMVVSPGGGRNADGRNLVWFLLT